VDVAARQMTKEQYRTAHVGIVCAEAGAETSVGKAQSRTEAAVPLEQIAVLTKCDRVTPPRGRTEFMLPTSAVTGEGVRELKAAIHAAVLRASMPQNEVVAGTAVRCGESLRLAAASLDRAQSEVRERYGEELIAAEVRVALNELGKVAGAVYTEDVLDRIFSRFCIGK
jgi:tRNA modification GTPase